MECKIKNDYGTIYIAEDVMMKVVGYAALECYGIVAMSGYLIGLEEKTCQRVFRFETPGICLMLIFSLLWNMAFPFLKCARQL